MSTAVPAAQALLAANRPSEAVAAIEAACAAGDVDAIMLLATWRLAGSPVTRDFAAARALLAEARRIGHVDAALMEVALIANGTGAAPDWAGALLLLKAAARGDYVAAAQLKLIEAMDLDADGAPKRLPSARTLGHSPTVRFVRGLLSPAECAHVAEVAAPLLEPSDVVDPLTGRLILHPIRTSHSAAIGPAREDLVIRALNHRVAAISATRVDQGEPLTVLHYSAGQQYRPHIDAIPGAANQRIRTVLIYLNQGYGGGETRFLANGLTIDAALGDALLFDNVLPDGSPDQQSRHAGLPITAGRKWLATRWIRAAPHDPWALSDAARA